MSALALVKRDRVQFHRLTGASALSAILLLGQSAPLLANPTGGAVVAGAATIGAAGKTLSINQSTSNAIINWQTFSIANGETTKFIVPSSSAATLNYVSAGNPSAIYGSLSSNGHLFLINPSGILVGSTGRIDTAGFLGSTLNANNSAFMNGGDLQFSGNSTASIINQGSINASQGNVLLIANQVSNQGSLTAPQGDVGLAAGSNVLLQQEGDQHLFVQSSPVGTKRAVGVTNSGTIKAATAELRAAGGNAYALAINNTGSIAATGYKKINGQVYLTADTGAISNSGHISSRTGTNGGTVKLLSQSGTITNSGSIDASATAASGTGGSVTLNSGSGLTVFSGAITAKGGAGGAGGNAEVSGHVLQFTGSVDLTAAGGKTGNLTLDPGTLEVVSSGTGTIINNQNDPNSSTIDPSTVEGVLATANLTLNADTNITITDALTWNSGSTLSLTTNTSGSTIVINAPITAANGGLFIETAGASDLITTGGGGSVQVASFIMQSGSWVQVASGLPLFSAPGNFEINGSASFMRAYGGNGSAGSPYLIADVYGLEGLSSPSGVYLTSDADVAANIDATMTAGWNGGLGWKPIGTWDEINSSDAGTYSGTFNGQGFTINGLTIDSPNSGFAGLFGDTANGAVVENVNLTGVNILGNEYVGALTGVSNATVTDCTSSGTVIGTDIVGGLLGIIGGPVSGSSSAGTVEGNANSGTVGGLIGEAQFGSITNSSSSANVETGTTTNSFDVGGLVGLNDVTITSSSSSGTVTGDVDTGGLVGFNSGTILSSSSSSVVTGRVEVGGLVGTNTGEVSTSFTTGSVTGNTGVGGLVGDNSSGSITLSYSVAATNGFDDVGGLVGENQALISNSFSTGTVTGSDDAVGGLIGLNFDGTVIDSYTAGTVVAGGATEVGGLVGDADGGSYTNVFWDTQSAGVANAAGTGSSTPTGIVGGTTANLENASFITSNSAGSPPWDFVSTWTTNGGTTLPQLVGVGGPGGTAGSGGNLDLLSGTAFTDAGLTTADGVTIELIFDGSVVGTTTSTGSGTFSFDISSSDVGTGLLLTDSTDKGNTYFQSGSNSTSFSGIDLWGSTLRVVADSASNTALKTTIGSLTANGINYSVSGANLSTTSGVGMNLVSGAYTIDGNVTVGGAFNAQSGTSLVGSTNATVQATAVTIDGAALNDTEALTIYSTSGAIVLEDVGTAQAPAIVDGLTLSSTQAVNIQDSYITLPSGDFSATGTGYTSTVDANGEANGVNIFNSNILLSGGNLTLNGTAGYTTTGGVLSSGLGVAIGNDGTTQTELATTGSGSITINGTANQTVSSKTQVEGVLVYEDNPSTLNNYISVQNGALTITGTVTGTTASGAGSNNASIGGVNIGAGTQVVATGSGSVAITGNTSGATSDAQGNDFSFISGVEIGGQVGVNSGALTIHGTAGTMNTSASTMNGDNEAAQGLPFSVGVIIDTTTGQGGTNILSGGGSTVTITGTGGAVTTTGAFTGDSVGVSFSDNTTSDFGTAPNAPPGTSLTSSGSFTGSTVSVTGTGGSINAGNGSNAGDADTAGVRIGGTVLVEDGGSLTVNGTGGALNVSNATGGSGDDRANSQGVRVAEGANVAGIGSANVTLIGTGGTVTANGNQNVGSVGVNIGVDGGGNDIFLSVSDGTLTITGTGGTSPDFGAGVAIHGTNGGQVEITGSPDGNGVDGTQVVITGTGGAGYSGTGTFSGSSIPNAGVVLADNVTIQTPFGVSISGAGGANSDGVGLDNLTSDTALDASPVSPTIHGDNISIVSTSGNVLVDAGLTATNDITITSPGTITLQDTGATGGFSTHNLSVSSQGAILVNNSISGTGTETIVSADGDITLGTNAALGATGSATLLEIAAGTDLPHSHYVINNSTLGANVITVSGGAQFAIFQADSASDVADNINFTTTNTQFGATFPEAITGNTLAFFVATADDRGPNSPLGEFPTTTPPPVNLIDLASQEDDSGSNLVPVSTVPQNGAPNGGQGGGNGNTGGPSFTFGNNSGGGGTGGGLASSSGNGGLIGPNDAGQLGGGALSNFSNPAVYSAFGNALGSFVYTSLSDALGQDFYPHDKHSGKGHDEGANGEIEIGAGGVVVLKGGKVVNVPSGQEPDQLDNALNQGTLHNLPGH